MSRARGMGSTEALCIVAIGTTLELASCGGTGAQAIGSSTGHRDGGGAGSSGSSGGGFAPSSLDADASAGVGATGGGSSGSSSGPGGDAGTVDAGAVGADVSTDGAPALPGCQSGDTTPCATFTTPTGTAIPLGPYGAQMDVNVGAGFANAVQSGDMPGNAGTCQAFAGLFNEDPSLTSQLLQTTHNGVTIDFSLYSVYRPATWPTEKVPVITWGNGTCAQPEGYGALLRYVASYGYVIVAANSRWVGSGSPAPMLHALDFAAAASADSSSPYYQRLDLTKIGAMGHSQGGQATASAASDSRVKDVIIFNAVDSGVSKPYLTISGDMDITNFTTQSMASAVSAASVPAAWLYYHNPAGMGSLRGHLVLMLSPGRVTGPTTAWWQMMFRGDAASHALFVGSSCGLCGQSSDFGYGANSLLN